ncbi:YeeE/YedE family protein [bacterium]|nr:YeeE/YedE family protein [bacterium]
MTYCAWWMGAVGLAGTGFLFCSSLRRPLGVSGYLRRLLNWKAEKAAELQEEKLVADQKAMREALLQATIKDLGDRLSPEQLAKLTAASAADKPCNDCKPSLRLPLTACLLFFLGVAVGGMWWAQWNGVWRVRWTLDPNYARLMGSGLQGYLVLLGGGFLVGWGTSMAGGCTSGHGLSGCSRFQPGSLAATVTFVGVGIVASLLMDALLG